MTCDKGCMPDWRVHSRRLSHLSCYDIIETHSLWPLLQLQIIEMILQDIVDAPLLCLYCHCLFDFFLSVKTSALVLI